MKKIFSTILALCLLSSCQDKKIIIINPKDIYLEDYHKIKRHMSLEDCQRILQGKGNVISKREHYLIVHFVNEDGSKVLVAFDRGFLYTKSQDDLKRQPKD